MDRAAEATTGSVCSADIAVPRHAEQVALYARVLTTGREPGWREDLMNRAGTPIIGLGARTEVYADLPVQWMPHIQVVDVATSMARAVALGGSELLHGRDAEGVSQWAVGVDPAGAAFGLIPLVPPGSAAVPGPGSGRILGLSLYTDDPARLAAFYRAMVGWSDAPSPVGLPAGAVRLDRPDGQPVATVLPDTAATGPVPPVWLLHLPVGDVAESLRRLEASGGRFLHRGHAAVDPAVPTATIEDLVGACVVLVEEQP